MATTYTVKFDIASEPVEVLSGTMITDAAQKAGIEISQPCGGQGRCGQCAVQVTSGKVRRRSIMRLTPEDVEQGFALACQTVIEGDITVVVPPQDKIQEHLATGQIAAEVTIPLGYNHSEDSDIHRIPVSLTPPSMEDQTSDWARLTTALRLKTGVDSFQVSLPILQRIPSILRDGDWAVTVVILKECSTRTNTSKGKCSNYAARVIDVLPGTIPDEKPLLGVAIDIGTTTVKVMLVDLLTGEVKAQSAEYNDQIARGEDVISRIIFASKENGDEKLRDLVVETINKLITKACRSARTKPSQIYKTVISGNSTMIHLLLKIPASGIRLAPFVTVINHLPIFTAAEIGLNISPQGVVDCLPGVASYVGADITAGVLSSGLDDTEKITLFLDIGTNGEMVLGSQDWLVTCACSAGPAFEGAGVLHGMRATAGAIDEVWINEDSLEVSWRVIGNGKPKGLCGSALISLLAEMLMTGIINKGGDINHTLDTPRTRKGSHGGEYVVAWADETQIGEDIVITDVDVDNLIRTKAAIFAGFTVLADSVGVPIEMVEQVLIGGGFGKFINVEKAIQIGLLPDMPWERFQFLGNTSLKGSYLALLDQYSRSRIAEIAGKMTYIELSADNRFFDDFTSAMFLPHTNMALFPTVEEAMKSKK
ncbi:MAG: ASKHA domain-containing protein [Chloroflexota bacterium]|nr:ASKHA domain-containing protein [Chloroflexota bacterium]